MCKAKIHSATVTETKLFYEGSITIDSALLEAVDIMPGEKVEVLNLHNGSRIETYVMEGEKDSGVICLNGPAARWAQVADKVIILSYALVDEAEIKKGWQPRRAIVGENNKIKKVV
jgi:aspartate 1-decarboxylase